MTNLFVCKWIRLLVSCVKQLPLKQACRIRYRVAIQPRKPWIIQKTLSIVKNCYFALNFVLKPWCLHFDVQSTGQKSRCIIILLWHLVYRVEITLCQFLHLDIQRTEQKWCCVNFLTFTLVLWMSKLKNWRTVSCFLPRALHSENKEIDATRFLVSALNVKVKKLTQISSAWPKIFRDPVPPYE